MFRISTIAVLTFMLLVSSCAKDQEALNKLEGLWKYKSASALGFTLDIKQLGFANGTLQFYKCSTSDASCT